MRRLARNEAARIYARLFWLRPRFDEIAKRSERIAAELFDTGVNMGPAVAATFLQRALTALNRNGSDFLSRRAHRSSDLHGAGLLPRPARQGRWRNRAAPRARSA